MGRFGQVQKLVILQYLKKDSPKHFNFMEIIYPNASIITPQVIKFVWSFTQFQCRLRHGVYCSIFPSCREYLMYVQGKKAKRGRKDFSCKIIQNSAWKPIDFFCQDKNFSVFVALVYSNKIGLFGGKKELIFGSSRKHNSKFLTNLNFPPKQKSPLSKNH